MLERAPTPLSKSDCEQQKACVKACLVWVKLAGKCAVRCLLSVGNEGVPEAYAAATTGSREIDQQSTCLPISCLTSQLLTTYSHRIYRW